ncbi:hypothetical protein AUC44_01225 [Deinococcus actinosclerus]|uniref:Uncharacterized protein n=1 Tax=Deinococcus actinosclerus TaxID=1768108 RepID=A0ABM5X1X3_9DEIO|nr:hypothetical protein AUC44_01225 [Deinococcus actinosclerus]
MGAQELGEVVAGGGDGGAALADEGGEVAQQLEGEVLGGLAAAEVGEGLGLFEGGGEGGGEAEPADAQAGPVELAEGADVEDGGVGGEGAEAGGWGVSVKGRSRRVSSSRVGRRVSWRCAARRCRAGWGRVVPVGLWWVGVRNARRGWWVRVWCAKWSGSRCWAVTGVPVRWAPAARMTSMAPK